MHAPLPERCDVLVIGAGIAGATTALLVKRRRSKARVVLMDARRQDKAVGTSRPLSPIASLFFSRSLQIDELLAREHLPGYGSHEWFARESGDTLATMSDLEDTSFDASRSHHVNVEKLAASIVELAKKEGVQVMEGVEVLEASITWPESELRVLGPEGESKLTTRWIVDASGRSAVLATQRHLVRALHTRTWMAEANWTNCTALDDLVLPEHERFAPHRLGSLEFSTHRFRSLDGCVRVSPHVGGGRSVELSLGSDPFADHAQGRSPLEEYSQRVRTWPGVRELLARAQLDPESFRSTRQEDWSVERHAGRGWFLVGRAAGVLSTASNDPLEALTLDVWGAAEAIDRDLSGQSSEGELIASLRRFEADARLRSTIQAAELYGSSTAFHAEAVSQAVLLALDASLASWRLRRAQRDLVHFGRDPRQLLWVQSLRGGLRERLRQLALGRQRAGTFATRNRHWHKRVAGRAAGLDLVAASGSWLALEYESLRQSMTPAHQDTHSAPLPEIERRARSMLAELELHRLR